MKDYRNYIKYYGGNEGTTTLEQFVQKSLAASQVAAEQQKVEEAETKKNDAAIAKRKTEEETAERLKERKTAEIVDKAAADEKALVAEYKKKVDAVTNDTPDRLEKRQGIS